MAEVINVFFIDERTGKEVPMATKDKDRKKKWLKGLLLPVGAFVVGIFYGFFTGGGGFRITRIEIKYVNPQRSIENV
jgi:uncharacterized membrane protein YfcA